MFVTIHNKRLSAAAAVAVVLTLTSTAAYASGSGDRQATAHEHPVTHGDVVSALAKTTTDTGRDKGNVISAAASVNGKIHAGIHAHTSNARNTLGPAQNHGRVISTLATTTTATGADKGATISTAASDGKSNAGQHGKAGDPHGKSQDPHGKAGDAHGNPTRPDPPDNSNKGGNGGADH